jgi:DNA mismatch repair ATPase MutS
MLAAELAFYVGCVNLHEELTTKQVELCFPTPGEREQPGLTADALRDASLVLRLGHQVVRNDVHAAGRSLVVITGANQGGKSTLLRGVGLALLMMQSGMFVAAKEFQAGVSAGIFTHYKREEDATMTSGKLDEELGRMNEIAEHLRPGDTVLFNESFAATNEREGSEIARQILHALTESGVRVFLVTHLFDLANGLHNEHPGAALFLRADRQDSGHRTFRIIEGAPLPTSYGTDLYDEVFADTTGNRPPVSANSGPPISAAAIPWSP